MRRGRPAPSGSLLPGAVTWPSVKAPRCLLPRHPDLMACDATWWGSVYREARTSLFCWHHPRRAPVRILTWFPFSVAGEQRGRSLHVALRLCVDGGRRPGPCLVWGWTPCLGPCPSLTSGSRQRACASHRQWWAPPSGSGQLMPGGTERSPWRTHPRASPRAQGSAAQDGQSWATPVEQWALVRPVLT